MLIAPETASGKDRCEWENKYLEYLFLAPWTGELRGVLCSFPEVSRDNEIQLPRVAPAFSPLPLVPLGITSQNDSMEGSAHLGTQTTKEGLSRGSHSDGAPAHLTNIS